MRYHLRDRGYWGRVPLLSRLQPDHEGDSAPIGAFEGASIGLRLAAAVGAFEAADQQLKQP